MGFTSLPLLGGLGAELVGLHAHHIADPNTKGKGAIEVGSYVKWEEVSGNATIHKRGQVTEMLSGGRVKIQPVDKDSSIVTVDSKDVELSRVTGMRMGMKTNLLEVAENVVGNSLILRMFGHHFTGPSRVLPFQTPHGNSSSRIL